jgi:hypothetical protein
MTSSVSLSVPAARNLLTPSFRIVSLQGVTPPSTLALAAECKALFADVRFDATALPVSALDLKATSYGVELVVEMRVPDRGQTQVVWVPIWRMVTCPWAPIATNGPEHLLHFMRETIASTMAHEVAESMLVFGVRVFDPHRPLLPRKIPHA